MAIGPHVGRGRTAELFAWGNDQAVKLFDDGWRRPSVEHEARIGRAVHASGLPSPAVGDVVGMGGRLGIIYERVDGASMLEVAITRPWRLVGLARLLAELQARVHACVIPELPSQRQRLADKIGRASPLSDALRKAALEALAGLPSGNAVCHGDFHPGNVLLSSRGPVIIDWVDATRGHPLADVARTCLLLSVGSPPSARAGRLAFVARRWFHALYLRRYLALRPASGDELAAWRLPVAAARLSEGIPEEQEQVLAIVEMAGR